jgi:hypothetical protein
MVELHAIAELHGVDETDADAAVELEGVCGPAPRQCRIVQMPAAAAPRCLFAIGPYHIEIVESRPLR